METMMGGTAWLLAQRGVKFYQVICTRGDLGSNDEQYTRESLAAIRREEAQAGARLLGFREVATLDYHDGELVPSLDLRAQLAGFYRRWQPDTLFTFDPSWAGQAHPDHTASGRAAVDALMPSKMRLYHPEQLANGSLANVTQVYFFTPASPSIIVDVTDVYDKKLAAAIAHLSQFPGGEEHLNWMRDLDVAAAKRAGLPEGRLAEQFAAMRVW
jgi:LmbE family N-acetylglucosaminyl deacetylase